ncbi:hypothetical protein [Flagellimonas allohymeniacidonis]|uniref:Uncharacterized protein n=1 Tax=Flagellimonas allohymeniacidonis TaxID=2517819 RepID=A0A4Q8QGL5_9FLAO|nr:hypothetical protein [Allomuricauda hymeniacidonis]TAI49631.1 hypothetical protein EW142_07490 [Allomuricauda hymeniacidonis]
MVFLFMLDRPWDYETFEEITLNNYETSKIGVIKKMELIKGCGLYLEFEDKNRKAISFKKDTATYGIGRDCFLNGLIKRNDYFQKIPKSNKCFIIRNDSIMLFDCNTNLDVDLKRAGTSIKKINEWKMEGKFRWEKLPYEPVMEYLDNDIYEKYNSEN